MLTYRVLVVLPVSVRADDEQQALDKALEYLHGREVTDFVALDRCAVVVDAPAETKRNDL